MLPSRWGKPSQSKERSGIGRTKLYALGKKHKKLFRKLDDATLVDYAYLDRILAKLPPAKLGADHKDTAA
jgi:hypothetical protein